MIAFSVAECVFISKEAKDIETAKEEIRRTIPILQTSLIFPNTLCLMPVIILSFFSENSFFLFS